MDAKFICYNGKFLLSSDKNLSHSNRAFYYGDALFETIHCFGTEPQFFQKHWRRLTHGMNVLRMDGGEDFSEENFEKYIGKILNRNRIFKGARVRLTVFRDQGGLYSPEKNSVSWLLESIPLFNERFELNSKGLKADIFGEVPKPVNRLSNLKTTNSLVFVLAGLFKKENNLDECFVLNQHGRIAECISSNLFLVFENKIITPPLSEGCIAGVMREVIIELVPEIKFDLVDQPVLETDLMEAEEIIITNAIQGIQWIGAYKDRRFFNFVARKLVRELNRKGFNA